MKKQKGIIVGVLTLILIMMVGYAMFSEKITINGTATAKGEFSYTITTLNGVMPEINTDDITTINTSRRLKNTESGTERYGLYHAEKGIENVLITNADNVITYSASLKYPGAIGYFTVKITNTGSIPITFDFWDDIKKETTITGNLIMSDGGRVDIDDIKKYTQGAIVGPYDFDLTDAAIINQLKAYLINLEAAYIPKTSHEAFVNSLEINPSSFPKIQTDESLYLVFSVSWIDTNFNEQVVGLDIIGNSKIILPIKQYVD